VCSGVPNSLLCATVMASSAALMSFLELMFEYYRHRPTTFSGVRVL
jgi:hypothetical protein